MRRAALLLIFALLVACDAHRPPVKRANKVNSESFEFLPSQRMSGRWELWFEESRFIPNQETGIGGNSMIWLEASPGMPTWQPPQRPRAYEVDFVGRLSKPKTQYYGMIERMVIVDRLISIREIPRPIRRPAPLPEANKN